ncbi:glycosyltransferase involved in cell wall biosynthesis/GNAT superfamily N-acetyltransferase [Micrococcus cohnii]|uniref:D-inositol 3-phosphate glycosyltransferase n=1 Tax=Micrococcus cohnii TaxID=993416 RepID=A0A7W7GP35_9MICC|nr:GNAT family N-acetyltransferase [Micrococcus cohnii]MBB4735682.1 glycosyltransferase involved in cell wall biosynthesis/GNAT superfamily N-acetyltransferase [Micrococcus cohnii]
MKIGILTQWYDPEPGPAALPGLMARALAARGHDVTVVTGFPNYPDGRLAAGYTMRPRTVEHRDGVRIVRTALFPSHGSGTVGRLLNYASFAVTSALLGAGELKDCDVVWVNYSPITIAAPMFRARYLHGVPVVSEVADLWPDTLTASGFGPGGRVGKAVTAVLHRWTNAMYAASEAVVPIAPSVVDVLHRRGVPRDKLTYIPKPGNEDVFASAGRDIRAELGIAPETVVLLYAGSMGAAQGLDGLVEACRGVDPNHLVCLLAGGGTEADTLRAAADSVPAVRFLGRRDPAEMPDLMATADVCYISLSEDPLTPYTIPSKTQATLAAGKPAMVAASGDVVALVEAAHAGFGVEQSSVSSIRAGLDRLVAEGRDGLAQWGVNAARAYSENFSVDRVTDQIEGLLAQIVGRSRLGTAAAEVADVRTGPLRRRHVRAAAALHKAAFPDFFLSSLGEGFLREFYSGFLQDPDAVTTIIEDEDQRLLGVAVGSRNPEGFFSRLLKRRLLGFGLRSAGIVAKDPRKAPRLLAGLAYRGGTSERPPADAALLSSICVAPEAQGTGTGRRLLERWCEQVVRSGRTHAMLTTDADANDAVNAFYRRSGWTVESEYTTPQGRRMYRYEKRLDSPAPDHSRSTHA